MIHKKITINSKITAKVHKLTNKYGSDFGDIYNPNIISINEITNNKNIKRRCIYAVSYED